MTAAASPPRVVGTFGAALISINSMIGAGIFALPALLYAQAGDFAPWMFLIFGLCYSCTVLVVARLATMFDASGGPQLYAQAAFGPLVGFLVGWLLVIGASSARAATMYVLVSYLAVIFPALDAPLARQISVLLLIAALCGLTLSGMRNAIGGMVIGTVIKLTPIAVLCLAAFAHGGIAVSFKPPSLDTFGSVTLLVYFAFSGAANPAATAGEIKDPHHTLPRSMLLSLAGIMLFYMIVQWAYIAAGAPGSSGDATPLAAAAGVLFGEVGVIVLTVAAIFSIATNALAYFVSGPRIIYGMADRGLLPPVFAHISPRFLTPDAAILLFAVIVIGFSFSGTFSSLATVMSLSAQIMTLSTFAAFVAFRLRKHNGHPDGLSPFWVLVVAIGVGFAIYACIQAPAEAYGMIAGLIVIGGLLALVAMRDKVQQPVPVYDEDEAAQPSPE